MRPPFPSNTMFQLPQPSRIEQPLLAIATEFPNRTAVISQSDSVTYSELLSLAAGTAAALREVGARPGDHVAVFLDKSIEAVAALYGIWLLGAVGVPIYEGLKHRQVHHILGHSSSRFLLTSERKRATLTGDTCVGVHVLIASRRRDEPQELSAPMTARQSTDPAVILYTSGSTGLPKGIVISHANLVAGARIVAGYLKLSADDRILSVLPFSFDYGLNQLLTSVNVGAVLALQRSHFPPDICRSLLELDITGMAAVPPLWIQLMSSLSPLKTLQLPKLRYITNSGGRFPVELVREYRRFLPHVSVYLMYGLSEAFRSTYLPPEYLDERPDSMGRAIPETEILVVDGEDRLCGPDEVGELVHRGPTVALGYWNDSEATARAFRPDTLPGGQPGSTIVFSGDLVRRDRDGFLSFVGRRDGMIKSQGYRISPEEVEETILASGLVDEVGVCGEPDELSGAAIVAHVVARNSTEFSAEALIKYCQREMPGYMVPHRIYPHAALPRTGSGKIDRKNLKP